MKPWMLLLAALLAIPGAGRAGEPPARIGLQAPSSVSPGESARMVVSLTGARGEPSPVSQEMGIEIKGAAGLGAPARVTIPAGNVSVEVAIRADKPGLWQIEASSPGLSSGFTVVACAAVRKMVAIPTAKAMAVQQEIYPSPPAWENSAMENRRILRPFPDVSRRLQPERVGAREPLPTAPPSPTGHVELIAQPPKLRWGRGGWASSQVEAYWFEGDAPVQILRDLNLSLVIDGGSGETRVAPTTLRIPMGQFKSVDAATISAHRADTAMVRALYPGGASKPVEVHFLRAEPTKLGFLGPPQLFRGLTSVDTDLFVRLLDDGGQPASTSEVRKVDVAVQGPTGVRSYSATVAPGETQAKIPVEFLRPGKYSIVASAAELGDSSPLEVRFALDWLLLACSLLGGALGSLTRVLYRRERIWPKGLPRILALGVAAALFVLLLSLFGVLSVLGSALPATEALQKVSATSLFGALLLGFLAGLVFDKVFGRFLGGAGGRRARPKGVAPASKGAV